MKDRPKKQNISIQQVTTALIDDHANFPPAYLHYFSDLEGADLEAVRMAWSQASPNRRFMLLESLEELAENDTLVSFDNLARIALKDEDARVRTVAIRLLWETEEPKLIPVFLKMLSEDPDVNVRAAAATALGLFIFLGELEEIPEKTLHQVEDRLLAVISGPDDDLVRRRALESLGFSGRPEVPPLIKEAYEKYNTDWLISALNAMGRSADDAWAPEVLRMLRHTQTSVQAEAVRAAGELALDAARRPLLQMLEDELQDSEVRLAIYWSLSKIGGEDVRETLEDRLEESEDEEEIDILEDSLDNLDFTEEVNPFDMLDLDDLPEEGETAEEYLSRGNALIVDENMELLDEEDDFLEDSTAGAQEEEGEKPETKSSSDKKRHRHHKSSGMS